MNECTAPKREGNETMSRIRREAEPYNLGEDFMHSKANISYAQIYNESPKQRENFHQVLKRGNPQWLHSVENIEQERKEIMSVRCKTEIKGNVIEAIVDSGAATNIITKGLLEKLGMKITESSNAVFSNVNGKKVPSLGKVDIKIKIKDTEIPMKVQVIDSTKRDLILGTEILAEVKGKINFEKNELKIEYNGKEIRTPIFYNRKKLEIQEYQDFEDEFEEFEEEELENDEDDEEEYEEEEFNESPAYYLAELS